MVEWSDFGQLAFPDFFEPGNYMRNDTEPAETDVDTVTDNLTDLINDTTSTVQTILERAALNLTAENVTTTTPETVTEKVLEVSCLSFATNEFAHF